VAAPTHDPLHQRLLRAASDIVRATERLRQSGFQDDALESVASFLRPELLGVASLGTGAAFEIDRRGRMIFDANGLACCVELAHLLHERGLAPFPLRSRTERMCFSSYILHEVRHRPQNLSDYGQVQALKAGLEDLGLPLMDVAADAFGAAGAAHVDCALEGQLTKAALLTALSAAHRIVVAFGAFVFKADGRAGKTQRLLSAALGKVLIDEYRFGRLNLAKLNAGWIPGAPTLLFNVTKVPQLNALLLQPSHAVLFDHGELQDVERLNQLWGGLDRGELDETFSRIGMFLREMSVIRS
jgi:hypothetical protein